MYFAGLPADVVTNLTPHSATKSTMDSSCKNKIGKFTPKGFLVSSDIFFISVLQISTSPEEVSITPNPPALETEDASLLLAIHPIGACIIGYFDPKCLVTLFIFISYLN